MKHGVKFTRKNDGISKHSMENWGLVLTSYEIPLPTAKTETIDIPGGNGIIDLTENFGKIFYNNRSITLNFTVNKGAKDWPTLISEISNFIHGQLMKITIYNDEKFYYLGRCSINKPNTNKLLKTISIVCNCDPFKYKQNITSVTHTVNGEEKLILNNCRKEVVPRIIVSDNVALTFNESKIELSAGEHKVLDIELLEGENEINITSGSGTITFEYQEGDL